MPVRRSRQTDLAQLIVQLSDTDPVVRESAAARLILIGERAVPSLLAAVGDDRATPTTRRGALRTVDTISRPAALDAAARAVSLDDATLAAEAIGLLGEALANPAEPAHADRALEHLTRLVLDTSIQERHRLGMMEPLGRLPASLSAPIFQVLANDTVPAIAARASQPATGPHGALERWSEDRRLPAEPDDLAAALTAHGPGAAVTTLRILVDLVRARERTAGTAERSAWHSVRGQLHEVLARRGSVIARYDLQEALDEIDAPVSTHLLAAAQAVADSSSLEAVALRWVRAQGDAWLRDQLERIFHAIVERDRLRRASPLLARIVKRHPSAAGLIATAPRTRPAHRPDGRPQ